MRRPHLELGGAARAVAEFHAGEATGGGLEPQERSPRQALERVPGHRLEGLRQLRLAEPGRLDQRDGQAALELRPFAARVGGADLGVGRREPALDPSRRRGAADLGRERRRQPLPMGCHLGRPRDLERGRDPGLIGMDEAGDRIAAGPRRGGGPGRRRACRDRRAADRERCRGSGRSDAALHGPLVASILVRHGIDSGRVL